MEQFISDISGKSFPVSERVNTGRVRGAILKEIQKKYPSFNENSRLSHAELSDFRQQYIRDLLAEEVGPLTELEHTVLDSINQNHLITDDASEVKHETPGQRWADRIASFGGSWKFIGLFSAFLVVWMLVNGLLLHRKSFDPFPFILLNLILSCLAAMQAPVIMMSQNRQDEKDRARARNDYMVNLKSELEIRLLHEKIDHLVSMQEEYQGGS